MGVGLVDDLRGRVDQVEHGFHVDQALTDRAIDPAEHVQGAEELHQQAVDPHHVAGTEAALAPAPDGEDHRASHHRVGDQRLTDVEPGEADFVADRSAGEGADRFLVALRLPVLGAEILDRFVVEERIDGAADRPVVDLIHLPLDVRAPISDLAGEGDVDRDDGEGRSDETGAELDQENDTDRGELDHRRGDVEQQEIKHHVDAFGPAFHDLGERAGSAFQVETQAEIVDVAEDLSGEPPRRILPDLLKNRVAQIIGQHTAEPARGISRHQSGNHRERRMRAHPVHRELERIRDCECDRLAGKHQHDCGDDPGLELGFAFRPEHRQKAPQSAEAAGWFRAGRGACHDA